MGFIETTESVLFSFTKSWYTFAIVTLQGLNDIFKRFTFYLKSRRHFFGLMFSPSWVKLKSAKMSQFWFLSQMIFNLPACSLVLSRRKFCFCASQCLDFISSREKTLQSLKERKMASKKCNRSKGNLSRFDLTSIPRGNEWLLFRNVVRIWNFPHLKLSQILISNYRKAVQILTFGLIFSRWRSREKEAFKIGSSYMKIHLKG